MDTKMYLKNVMELEQAIYTLDKSIRDLQLKTRNLGIAKKYDEPEKPMEHDAFTNIAMTVVSGAIGAGIGIPVGIVFGIIRWFSGAKFGTSFWGCILVLGIVGIFVGFFLDSSTEDYAKSQYYVQLNRYDRLVDEDKKRIDYELRQKKSLDLQINSLSHKKQELIQTLNTLYNMNIIYPKYRKFVIVAMLYEYFASGRCNVLEGHEGAYNIYENEIRLNIIITKLDDIIDRLDEIRVNQYQVYNAINEGNKIANNIYQQSIKCAQTMDAIEENAAVTAYNTTLTARNSEILKFIAVYNTMKN